MVSKNTSRENDEDSEMNVVQDEDGEGDAVALKKLHEKLAKVIQEKQEYLEGWQRARADFVNFKQTELRREGELRERITSEIVEEFIPIFDSLGMALQHTDSNSSDLKKGITQVYQQCLSLLKKFDIEQVGIPGEIFDPRRHHAIREEAVKDKSLEHKIVNVHRQGYLYGERVIRPAEVSVGVYTP